MNQVMTNDQIRAVAPSVFATEPWHQMSDRYAFIPTIQVVERLRQEGFEVVQAMQSKSRVEGKADFTKHLVRFRRQGEQPVAGVAGTLYPELLLGNAHDGASTYWLDSGIFSLVCENGLVIGDDIMNHLKVRHFGRVDQVLDATFEIVEEMPRMIESIEKFQAVRLDAGEQRAYATAALALRYDEGKAPITPEQVIRPRRQEESEPTLWNTFNVAQETLVTGGDRYRTANGRRARTRAVTGITENTRLNKALWTLAEELRKLHG